MMMILETSMRRSFDGDDLENLYQEPFKGLARGKWLGLDRSSR